MRIGDVVRRLREQRGWTQKELAKRMGNVEQNTISAIELGRTGIPGPATLHALADTLGISELDLLRLTGHIRTPPDPNEIAPELQSINSDIRRLPPSMRQPRLEALVQMNRLLRDAQAPGTNNHEPGEPTPS